MNKYILSIISIISLPFLAQEKTDLLLPELGDRVSGAVSSSQEKMIGKEFLKQVYFQAPLITDSLIQEYTELLIYRLSEYSEVKDRNFTVILIDDAINELEKIDKRQAEIIELRFFGGLTVKEVAESLNVSKRTVEGDWTMAKAWLQRYINRERA